jgi:3-hydroxyacyl-[acyl-carrier-protein] dehydratase
VNHLRFRGAAHAGDTVEIEATVRQLRDNVGRFRGVARVNGRVIAHGTMSFALGPRPPHI